MYRAKINEGGQFDIEVSGDKYSANGQEVEFDCKHIGDDKFHLIIDDRSVKAQLLSMDKAKSSFLFLIDGVEIELELEDQYDLLLDELGMEKGGGASVKNIQAPMPGLVLQVNVSVGDEISEDDPLIVLEAMKMENVIKAPKDVKIAAVEVEVGQKVDKGQVLINFEQ